MMNAENQGDQTQNVGAKNDWVEGVKLKTPLYAPS